MDNKQKAIIYADNGITVEEILTRDPQEVFSDQDYAIREINASLLVKLGANKNCKYEIIGETHDELFIVKFTCENEWLEKKLTVETNSNCIGITPFLDGHMAQIQAYDTSGQLSKLYGYFPEPHIRTKDENSYIEGIVSTLTEGVIEDGFGSYK